MKKYFIFFAIPLLAASCLKHAEAPTQVTQNFDGRLEVDSPKNGDTIGQTFTVSGKAQGWFEGTVPLSVYDSQGDQLYKGSFILGQDNTTGPVSFNQSITLTSQAQSKDGYIEFDDYSAKDGSVVYKKTVNVNFSNYKTAQLNIYTSPSKYGFSIKYPSDFGFSTDIHQVQALSYIPACDQNMLACAFLNRADYKATNFDGAGVSVEIIAQPVKKNNLTPEQLCYQFSDPTSEAQKQIADVTINGVDFKSATGGGGAAGHYDKLQIYRNFHNNMCYEISQDLSETQVANYPAGTVTQVDENAVWQKLQGVVNTFKFIVISQPEAVNPVSPPSPINPVKSGIVGIAMLGPNCPYMPSPPDPSCADTPYQTNLAVTTLDRTQVIKTFQTGTDGKFMVDVPAGEYYIAPAPGSTTPPTCRSNGTVIVKDNTYTNVTVNCDTGIR